MYIAKKKLYQLTSQKYTVYCVGSWGGAKGGGVHFYEKNVIPKKYNLLRQILLKVWAMSQKIIY